MKAAVLYESGRYIRKWTFNVKVADAYESDRSDDFQKLMHSKLQNLQFLDGMNFSGKASYDLVLDWFRGIIID